MRGDLSDDPSKHGVIQRSVFNLFRRLADHEYTDMKVDACKYLGYACLCFLLDLLLSPILFAFLRFHAAFFKFLE